MNMNKQTIARAALAAALALAALPAAAQTWSRSGPRGEATRTYDQQTGQYTVDRYGANGGSSSATVDCQRGGGVRCTRDYSATGPDGQSLSGTRQSNYGPYRGRSANTVTAPNGQTYTRARPAYRYNRVTRPYRRW